MKIYFVRHGESFDDVYNEYGSWSERELTPQGIKTAFNIAEKLKKIGLKWDVILASPLKRAWQTGEIIANELNLPMLDDPYLKERNTYGLLTGVNKDLAIEEYPEMNAAFLEGRYIVGSERYPDFVARIKAWIKAVKIMKYQNIICATHGHVITALVEELFGVTRNSVGNGSILGIELDKKNKKIIFADGITFTRDENVGRGVALRKFKVD
ncbi:MAG: histidine phosphatase family protein [Pedobacter sp.]|jgi:broad specificity phosphatase PhoE